VQPAGDLFAVFEELEGGHARDAARAGRLLVFINVYLQKHAGLPQLCPAVAIRPAPRAAGTDTGTHTSQPSRGAAKTRGGGGIHKRELTSIAMDSTVGAIRWHGPHPAPHHTQLAARARALLLLARALLLARGRVRVSRTRMRRPGARTHIGR